MRSNALKTCAVGAMLFGGTLGVTQTASAGLTWLGAPPWADPSDSYSDKSSSYFRLRNTGTAPWTGAYGGDVGALAFNAVTLAPTNPGFAGMQVSFSGVTASGPLAGSISMTAYAPSQSAGLTAGGFVAFYFEVTDTQRITLNSASGLLESEIQLVKYGSGTVDYFLGSIGSTAFNKSYDLDAGIYSISMQGYAGDIAGGFNGEVFSMTVPAPGAAALIGMAGLVGGRRRRA